MNNFVNDPPRMRPIRAAAKEAGVPEHWLRCAVKEGRIVYVQAGRKILVNVDKLFDYLNRGDAQ